MFLKIYEKCLKLKQVISILKNVLLLYLFAQIRVIPNGLYQRNEKVRDLVRLHNFLSAGVITLRVIPYFY